MTNTVRIISFGVVDGEAIFMDEKTDTYFTIDDLAPELLCPINDSGALADEKPLRDILGITSEHVRIVRAHCAPPSRSLIEECASARADFADILKIANLVRKTRSALRSQPFHVVLSSVFNCASRPQAKCKSRDVLIQTAVRFLVGRRLAPLNRHCLVDSLAMLRWLEPGSSDIALVFGAKLAPFAAHCWLQQGDMLLNDRSENISAFTPVRVIRCSDITL